MVPLFIDCDPGIDDAMALGYAMVQPDVEIIGVAATGGNVPTAQVTRNALGWLSLAGREDVPVHEGAALPLSGVAEYADDTHGESGAGYAVLPESASALSTVPAAQAWADAARARPGELIGVLLGPATNLALALEIEPALPRLLRRVFVMGGAFNYRGNTRPTTEWNISCDPEAASAVFRAFGAAGSGRLPVIAPLEATEALVMTPERLDALTAAQPRSVFLKQLAEALRFYFEFHASDGHGYLAHVHDPYVLATAVAWARTAAVHGSAVRGSAMRDTMVPGTSAHDSPHGSGQDMIPWADTALVAVDVELQGTLTRGETVADWLGRWGRASNAEVIRRIDAGTFLDHFHDELSKGLLP